MIFSTTSIARAVACACTVWRLQAQATPPPPLLVEQLPFPPHLQPGTRVVYLDGLAAGAYDQSFGGDFDFAAPQEGGSSVVRFTLDPLTGDNDAALVVFLEPKVGPGQFNEIGFYLKGPGAPTAAVTLGSIDSPPSKCYTKFMVLRYTKS